MPSSSNKSLDAITVSIIIPVYNVANYLEECLRSVEHQTLRNIEAICIDDGSTDGSSDILEKYAKRDNRFRVISQSNSGVSAARNKGLNNASGEYVMFVDSDDYIREDTCEKLYLFSEKNELDIAVFGGKTFPTVHWADDCFAQNNVIYTGDGVRALFDEPGSRPLMCNKMFRRDFIETNHCVLDSSLELGEDHAFQFDTFPFAKKIGYLNDKLYFYRTRESSAVNASIEDYFRRIMKHIHVVSSVFVSWKGTGLFDKYEDDLCVWAANFLYQDAQYLYPDELNQFSQRYKDLLDKFCLMRVVDRAPEYIKEKIEWMLDCGQGKRVEGAESVLDLIVEIDENCPGLRALADSMMHSPDRRFSLKLVCKGDSDNVESAIPIPVDGGQIGLYRSVDDALKSCESLYIGFTSAVCRYTEGFLGKVIDSINVFSESGPFASLGFPDVISFADEDGLLGVSDFLAVSKPSTRRALVDKYYFDPASLEGDWCLAAAPVPWNKIYLRESFLSFYQANEKDQSAPFAASVFSFQSKCGSILHLFDFDALAVDQSISTHMNVVETELVGRGLGLSDWMEVGDKDALYLALLFCSIKLDLSISCIDFYELFKIVSDLLKELKEHKPSAFIELQSSCSDKRILSLMSGKSPEEYREERAMNLLSAFQARGKKDSDLLEAQRRLIAELNERLDALSSSVSFRVGRKITSVPRKIASVFSLR